MKKWILALGACAALSTLPMGAFAHGYWYNAGDAALGGLVGSVVGGLIGSGIAPYPAYVAPAPVIVEPYYTPAPVVIERYAPVVVAPYGPPAVYYRGGNRGWYRHGGGRRYWHDD